MFMLTRNKFRAIAGIIVLALVYWFIVGYSDSHETSKEVRIEKNWQSIADNCGYEPYLENPFQANELYEKYNDLGEWTLEGFFLREEPLIEKSAMKLYIKMNPSQFKNK